MIYVYYENTRTYIKTAIQFFMLVYLIFISFSIPVLLSSYLSNIY